MALNVQYLFQTKLLQMPRMYEMALAAMSGMPGMSAEQVEGAQVDHRVEQAHDDEAHGLAGHAVAAQEPGNQPRTHGPCGLGKSRAIC